MQIFSIDPLTDARWPAFLERADGASIFHTTGWLAALREAYGYLPVAYTDATAGADLRNALVFCHVHSRLTGNRLVSLPFADHCQALVDSPEVLDSILAHVASERERAGYRYAEIRSLSGMDLAGGAQVRPGISASYAFHMIDLTIAESALFEHLHKTSIKQMIGRAQREGLTISRGRDAWHQDAFYKLLLLTRRKHKVPPQPRSWYRILSNRLGEAITFHVAQFENKPVAAIVTLAYRSSIVHKYGCSDPAESQRGGTQLLLWEALRKGQAAGATTFDMGRSDLDNEGLLRFKERWGGVRSNLHYHRLPDPGPLEAHAPGRWKARVVETAFAHMPDAMLELAGRLLYRHVG